MHLHWAACFDTPSMAPISDQLRFARGDSIGLIRFRDDRAQRLRHSCTRLSAAGNGGSYLAHLSELET